MMVYVENIAYNTVMKDVVQKSTLSFDTERIPYKR